MPAETVLHLPPLLRPAFFYAASLSSAGTELVAASLFLRGPTTPFSPSSPVLSRRRRAVRRKMRWSSTRASFFGGRDIG